MTTVRTALPAGTMAVPAARRFVAAILDAWRLPEQTRETTELVVSELVGNAVEHGGGLTELGLTLLGETVRVDVLDDNPELPVMLSPTPFEARHRGLLIVAALSTRWGSERVGSGKSVWAELPFPAADGAPADRSAPADDHSMSG